MSDAPVVVPPQAVVLHGATGSFDAATHTHTRGELPVTHTPAHMQARTHTRADAPVHPYGSAPTQTTPWLSISARRFLSGALSGTFTAAILQPFDVVRTAQQGAISASVGLTRARGPVTVAADIVRSEGAAGLWKGLGPTLARVFFGAGIYFVSLSTLSDLARAQSALSASVTAEKDGKPDRTPLTPSQSFLVGMLARSLAATLMAPISVVKTRMEFAPRGKSGFTSTPNAIATIARTEGITALYAGLVPTIVRDAPFSGIYVALYNIINGWMAHSAFGAALPGDAARNFSAGFVAGALACIVTQPADLIRTRLQLNAVPNATAWRSGTILIQSLRDIAASEGVRGLFLGGTARILKRTLSSAITWALFEEGMRRSGGGGG